MGLKSDFSIISVLLLRGQELDVAILDFSDALQTRFVIGIHLAKDEG